MKKGARYVEKEKDQNQKTDRRRIRQLYNGVKGRKATLSGQKIAEINPVFPDRERWYARDF